MFAINAIILGRHFESEKTQVHAKRRRENDVKLKVRFTVTLTSIVSL